MNEIPKLLTEEEFQRELETIKLKIEEHGYIESVSKNAFVIGWITSPSAHVHTPAQLQQIFDLAWEQK